MPFVFLRELEPPYPFGNKEDKRGNGNGEGSSSTEREFGFGEGIIVFVRAVDIWLGPYEGGGGDVAILLRNLRVMGGRDCESKDASATRYLALYV